jgi:hypothetical protein
MSKTRARIRKNPRSIAKRQEPSKERRKHFLQLRTQVLPVRLDSSPQAVEEFFLSTYTKKKASKIVTARQNIGVSKELPRVFEVEPFGATQMGQTLEDVVFDVAAEMSRFTPSSGESERS